MEKDSAEVDRGQVWFAFLIHVSANNYNTKLSPSSYFISYFLNLYRKHLNQLKFVSSVSYKFQETKQNKNAK
jgi:hypothetical protein